MHHPIPPSESGERLLAEASSRKRHSKQYVIACPRTALIVVFIVVTASAYVLGYFTGQHVHDWNSLCSLRTSKYSPLVKTIGIKYHDQTFNGSFLKENIFRQEASPAVDAAWDSIGVNYRGIRISVQEAFKSGLSKDHVQISPSHGGGFPAHVEGLHHLHCLNLLRQALYYNYEYYRARGDGAFKNEEYIVRKHVSHCLDILRQQLMCTVDFGVFGQIWVYPDNPEPFVDFNSVHVCRNFEAVREWAERNQLPEKVSGGFLVRPERSSVYDEIP
ncbi:hypothetical protein P168DRAFT_257591 [Aspergillus campestris IBT 28561]|uniref:Tat pathway signal sequence n=1 Tax=Aspergillus campestris (strain IBT 28561) TaxID=1392248 RepID=A0A2I1CXH5_ASPC2|nr:uncharacterized protein P168DRAFT_257591 [Aspergillus campestris IBT 28561]PKY02318.1 hypothetical protein P168DRAFT_257591 [Aspergillus campestris IBT 28561]